MTSLAMSLGIRVLRKERPLVAIRGYAFGRFEVHLRLRTTDGNQTFRVVDDGSARLSANGNELPRVCWALPNRRGPANSLVNSYLSQAGIGSITVAAPVSPELALCVDVNTPP